MDTIPSIHATPRYPSSVRHTCAIARDRSKHAPSRLPDEQFGARLTELIHSLTLGQVAHYLSLGPRERVLSPPVMMAMVLSTRSRQIGSVATLDHWLQHTATVRDGLAWNGEGADRRQVRLVERARLRHGYPDAAGLGTDRSTLLQDMETGDCVAPHGV